MPSIGSVSVIVPCHNYAHYLVECVQSVLRQPGVDVRVLIIDDASTDDSWVVAGKLSAVDNRVERTRHHNNQGHIQTYNEGLEWAAGDYTVLLSADDLLVPGALARAVELLNANPSVGFAYGRSLFFTSNDDLPAPRLGPPRWEIWSGHDWLAERFKSGGNCISSPEVVVRTSMYRQLGGYRTDLPHSGDLEMWMRFAAHADVGYVAKADQAYYRVHPKSMQRSWLKSPSLELRQRATAFETFFVHYGDRLAEPQPMRLTAGRALAREALWRAARIYDRGLGPELAAELVAFAFEVYPRAADLGDYRGLVLRRRLGPRLAPLAQPLWLPWLIERRIRSRIWWRRWALHGV